jgi:hypothetical protein
MGFLDFFIETEKWFHGFSGSSQTDENKHDKDVKVLRNCMFFHADQTTKLSRIEAHFSEFAIQKLINDKFIEIL